MYRGSSSELAGGYKRSGHAKEILFSKMIGGSTDGLPPQGKTDCIGPSGETYSVKSGKKWQVFLYGLERLKSDPGFIALSDKGLDLSRLLECFPDDYALYVQDKQVAKDHILNSLGSEPRESVISKYISSTMSSNLYVKSKLSLAQVTLEFCSKLTSAELMREFLRKSLFNGAEVSHLAVEDSGRFRIFQAVDVLDSLVRTLSVSTSGTGGHRGDLSIAGQKILMKKPTNVVELEVRNDSIHHYKQLLFNMKAKPALSLLKEQLPVMSMSDSLIWHSIIGDQD
jgi:hypothetical protein